jgi:hypothetical protein
MAGTGRKTLKPFDPFEKYREEVSGFDEVACAIYQRVWDRILVLEADGKNPAIYKRIVDLKRPTSRGIWKAIDSLTGSSRISNERKLEREAAIVELLTNGIDLKLSAQIVDDDRPIKAQMKSVSEIRILAGQLIRQIIGARNGCVTDLLESLNRAEHHEPIPLEELDLYSKSNHWAISAWINQEKLNSPHIQPMSLLLGLTQLKKSVEKFKPNLERVSKRSAGFVSRKKSQDTVFIIRLHMDLERIFGKPCYGLNADISTSVLNRSFSRRQTKEIIDRSRERGEIRRVKSTEHPRT